MASTTKRNCKTDMSEEVPVEKLLEAWSTDSNADVAGEICERLTKQKMYRDLEAFLKTLPNDGGFKENQEIVKGKIACFLERKKYNKAYKLIAGNNFSDKEGMVKVWDEAHYQQHGAFTSLARFRVRERFLPPPSICPSRRREKITLPKEATDVLKAWLSKNESKPYPSKTTKEQLAEQTGLRVSQVTTWFANARRKLERKSLRESQEKPEEEKVVVQWTSEQECTSGTLPSHSSNCCYATAYSEVCTCYAPMNQSGLFHGGLLPELYEQRNYGELYAANILANFAHPDWTL